MSALRRFIMVMGLLLYVPSAIPAQTQEQDWNQLIACARREGKVVVSGPPNPDVRRDLPARFKKRFGIPLEYIGGRSSVLAGKLRVERRVGTFTLDVAISGQYAGGHRRVLRTGPCPHSAPGRAVFRVCLGFHL